MKIGFIGGGTMAEAIIGAVLSGKLAAPEDIVVGEPLAQRREDLAERHKVNVTSDNAKAIRGAEIVVLAVKPNQFPTVAAGLKERLRPNQTVVSIMAGVTIAALRDGLNHDAVVRVMPNMPAQVGEGMSVWTATSELSEDHREKVRKMLKAAGRELYFEEERFIDMATAVSGSGPGFIFLLMEAFSDGAVHLGLSREAARELVVQTFLGSARLAQETGRPVSELRALVTTPGGTTAEGLLVLEEAGLRAAITEALIATYEKSKALGG
ncbi:MAG: pyrroline-5-carboxylate reductase [Dehalococcoidia bacterium]|nr:pyrroline-5-carboxylate reductase [Dehalococcoidia bacterium]